MAKNSFSGSEELVNPSNMHKDVCGQKSNDTKMYVPTTTPEKPFLSRLWTVAK